MNTKNLKKRRTQLKLSQLEVAEAVGIDKGTYFRIEKNNAETTVSVLEAIAKKLDCSTDYLLGLTDEPHGYAGSVRDSDEELLMVKIKSGEVAQASAQAIELAQRYHEANVSGMKPATDS